MTKSPGRRAEPKKAPPQTRRRPAEVRRLLLEAAERVVVEKGPAAATAQEIAREAGVHRSILYRYYTNAEELVQEATLRPFRDFYAMYQSLAADQPDDDPRPLWDLLVGFLDKLTSNLEDHRGFLVKVLADAAMIDEEGSVDPYAQLSDVIDEIISLSATVGGPRGINVPAMPVTGRLVLAMAAGVITYGDWLLPRGEQALSRQQLLDEMADFILYGAKVYPARDKKVDLKPPPRRSPK